MTINTSITESNIFQALGLFLQNLVPSTVPVVRGQQNRVSEPIGTDFIVMWPLTRERISMNTDSFNDVAFLGSINGTTLTVSQLLQGVIEAGQLIDATGVLDITHITGFLSGTGGAGTYTVDKTQVLSSTTMQAGTREVVQASKVTMQVDVHGPNSAEYAQIISTLARDEYGVNFFASESLGALGIQPLYSSDPRQMPFTDGEQQVEERWTVEVTLQANPVISLQQDFAGTVSLGIIKDATTYPV
jgi:hypothetical protein